MAIHTQEGFMAQRLLGTVNWTDQDCYQEGFGETVCVTFNLGDHHCRNRGDA